ncbi:hypothetical protein KJ780_02735 [Candidatus Micrarchaeota archaeon]|nr:hypothetical protein [Candidatus Micrarchaeota archaeon]
MNKISIIFGLVLFTLFLSMGCIDGNIQFNNSTQITNISGVMVYCSDQTPSGQCSDTKPFFCDKGVLVSNYKKCGCAKGEVLESNACRAGILCTNENGTVNHGECFSSKPSYCNDGRIVDNSSFCGCPNGYLAEKNLCINLYPADGYKTFLWTYKGEPYWASLSINEEMNQYYEEIPREYLCAGDCPDNWEVDYYHQVLEDELQQQAVDDLVSSVNESNSDERLQILLAFSQSIPYDWSATGDIEYPYQVIYNYKGVCNGKTMLGALIGKKLGYGVALFSYENESHMALGIKCPAQYASYNSSYCFIEMTANCSRFTDNSRVYAQGIRIISTPRIFEIYDGKALDENTLQEITEELADFRYAEQRIEVLEELISDASSVQQYNEYIEEYNSYVEIYNSFLNCS